jgi:hypothetical protein
MYNARLFLGFPKEHELNFALQKINPALLSAFIQGDENYLKEIVYEKKKYLGKYISNPADLQTLELLQENIYSLLKRLIPDYPYQNTPLSLLPILEA